jgi:serine protease Do
MKISFGEGLGFAIPVEQLKYFLDHRDAFAYDTDNPSNPYRYLAPPSRLKESETAAAATGGNRRTASPRANAPGK